MGIRRFIAKAMRIVFKPAAITNSKIDRKSKVCSGSQINDALIDRFTYIGHDCFVLCAEIGPFCSIADNCRIGGINHATEFVSSSPVFNIGKNVLKKNFARFESHKEARIIIGPDVWIGANVVIKSGITIGVGSVIGAGSVVTHDIGNYEIWAGNPAKMIKRRFPESLSEKLSETEWWNWEEWKIKKYAQYFSDPELFVQIVNR